MAEIVRVELGSDAYPIHIAPGLLADAGALLRPLLPGPQALVVADEQVARHHGQRLVDALTSAGLRVHLATFPAGELSKTMATAERLWQACAEHRIDRGDAIVALGGGVSGDLAGYVAACWMRGIRFAQVPTSLLAMVDSSVGGKTGVNSAAGKNLVGAFKQPVGVVIDTTLVATMDAREYRSGLAEVLKYGVIRDPAFFAWQEANAAALVARDPQAVARAVAQSCRIKADYVAADPFERGIRAQLNYGHTFGHALERETGYGRYLHGEAVAVGMRMAAACAQRLGVLADATLIARQDDLIARFDLPARHVAEAGQLERLVAHCRLDKKVSGGRTRFILPVRMGEVVLSEAPDETQVAAGFAAGLS
ncbi:MAG: 3-dehydroquinate synthase [Planctomycetes bacterium]|nr:3-dehydroquinate synthase [Planctomycetota bacterium]